MKTIIEAAREELLGTLSDLIERYDYEIVRDALWGLKPDTSDLFYCGDCYEYHEIDKCELKSGGEK